MEVVDDGGGESSESNSIRPAYMLVLLAQLSQLGFPHLTFRSVIISSKSSYGVHM